MKKKTKKQKSAIKRSTVGFEVEFLIIDKEGRIAQGADEILAKVAKEAQKSGIVMECAKNLIEVGSYPEVESGNTMRNLIDNIRLLIHAAEECGYMLCPLGTYPGKFTPEMRNQPRYKVQVELFGKQRFQIAGRCAGYHCHYALPYGVFDPASRSLKNLVDSKNQESLIHAYNLLVALDPVLTTFMQSSPFYEGRHLAKDSRMLVYRGSGELGYKKGLYGNLPLFGSLPSYEHAGADISKLTENRFAQWQELLTRAGAKGKMEYKSKLDTNWSPVKVNAHGTLEQRGMDMNHLPILLSVSVLIQRILRFVQEEYYKVVPHDSGKAEPFTLEKKTIYIPPFTYVKDHLQKLSAHEGLGSDEVFAYCRRAVNLVKALEGEKIEWLLKPLEAMLAEQQTVSDKIIGQAKNLGHKSLKKPLPQKIAQEIALAHSKQMFQDIVLLEEMIEANHTFS